jgi:hypothetical protein
MAKKRVYLVCVLFILFGLTQKVYSQRFSPDLWHNGGVVFKTGDTLEGKIFYSLSDNSVQVEEEGNKHFYNAFKLESVFFENVLDSSYRTFLVYNYKLPNGYERPQFFEMLYEDSLLSLLGRERLMIKSKGAGFGGGVEMGFDFYLKYKDGTIKAIPVKKKSLILVFPSEHKRLTDFIKERKTDFTSLEDMKEVVAFYNLIKQI